MKTILLTETQKDKIMEMCKTMFPEYNFHWDIVYPKTLNVYIKGEKLIIHWFEFYMLHLVPAIATELNCPWYPGLMLHITLQKVDPINYIYQKLKNENTKLSKSKKI